MPACPARLVEYLHKYFQGAYIKSAYEAGFSGFHLHRTLVDNKIDNIVVHAAAIEVSSRDRVKTDKRDATKIAIQLSSNRLRSIYIPSEEREDHRELTRLREDLVREKTRLSAKLKHKANYYGFIGPEDSKKVSAQWIKDLMQKEISPGIRYHIETLVERWEFIHKKIGEVNKRLESQAEQDEDIEKVYRSVKGVGPTAARVLANELGDMSQFASEKFLFSYTGLTPCEYSSGEYRRQGHISRQGKPILRKILIQCAWIAIRYDKDLKGIYDRIASRAGGKRAIVAVGRRLIGRIRACFRKNEVYQTSGWENLEASQENVA